MPSKLKDLPKHQLPREKIIALGPANLKNHELIAILLRTGTKEKNVLKLSQSILDKFPLKKLLDITYQDLLKISGINSAKATTILAAFELVGRATKSFNNTLPIIITPAQALIHLSNITNAKQEHFVGLYLNARSQLVHKQTITIGTINQSLVHPREVFAPAIHHLATALIVAHNHPSGSVEPSEDDNRVTQTLTKAGELLGIELIDHIIVTDHKYYSYKERGIV